MLKTYGLPILLAAIGTAIALLAMRKLSPATAA